MPIPLPSHPPVPVDPDQLRRLLQFAASLADLSGQVILPHFRVPLAVVNKAEGEAYDPVTVADRDAEEAIRARIREQFPAHGIYGEEHGYEPGSAGLTWVLDPVDGTRAFLTGIPLWGTLIALHDGARPILGVMDQPFTGERFVGSALGAELQSRDGTRPLRTRACPDLASARLQCTHTNMFRPAELTAFEALARRVQLTRFSGDCYGYCMVALGGIDLVVESGLQPYDVQALLPILEAAGGVMTNWSGGPCGNGGQVIAAGDPRVHAQALEILASAASAT